MLTSHTCSMVKDIPACNEDHNDKPLYFNKQMFIYNTLFLHYGVKYLPRHSQRYLQPLKALFNSPIGLPALLLREHLPALLPISIHLFPSTPSQVINIFEELKNIKGNMISLSTTILKESSLSL